MLYSVEAMAPTVFHWAEALLVVFKKQLTKCIHGELKRFGYGTIIMSFFLERVPLLRPQVAFNELRERDSRMLQWVEVMAHHGGGRPRVKYVESCFCWLDDQLLMIEYYAYANTEFRDDPDLSLPEDEQWGGLSK